MKKLTFLSLCVILTLNIFATDFTVDGVAYTITDATNKTVAIGTGGTIRSAISSSTTGEFSIPYSVINNGTTYSVTSIGVYAFCYCSGLTSVTIPNSVTTISSNAFYYCSGLTSVTIPNSVTFIEDFIFYGCSGLTSINVDANNLNYLSLDGVLFNKDKTTLIQYPQKKTITNYTIPSSVTNIEYAAFYCCSGLTSVTIPSLVTSIGAYAFYGCSGLTSVTIPSLVSSIGDYAFVKCSGLTTVNVDANNINYLSLEGVLFNKDKTTLLQYPPQKISKNYTIQNSVTYIGKGAFENSSGLSSVTIPSSVTSIGDFAFSGCPGLTSITIPSSVTSIGSNAFRGCSGLTSVTIPSSVTSIEAYVFYNCSNLSTVTIPSSVSYIGYFAFAGCSGLTSISVDDSNPNYCSNNGSLFNKSKTDLIQYALGDTNKNYIIPNYVTSINDAAFYKCPNLTSITIPSSVTYIGYYSLKDCSKLTSIYLKNPDPSKINVNFEVFNDVTKTTCKLYVPKASKYLYEYAYPWKDFTNIVEEEVTSGIESHTPAELNIKTQGNTLNLSSVELGTNVQVVDILGRVVYKEKATNETINIDVPKTGVYIVRIGNRQAKVFVQ